MFEGIKSLFKSPEPKEIATASYGHSNFSFTVGYDGEKNKGEVGPIKNYLVDYYALSQRAWQVYLDSDIANTLVSKYVGWVIGSGLRLDANPLTKVLESENIEISEDEWSNLTETRFNLYANSKLSDHAGMANLHKLAQRAITHSVVSGDCLVVFRRESKRFTAQVIDGYHVQTPLLGRWVEEAENRKNRIRHGIEMNSKGQHVAYYVKQNATTYTRVPAQFSQTKDARAILVCADKYRVDDVRGLSKLASIIESLSKLDRYKEATVGTAEEVAKVVYYIKHNEHSDGRAPGMLAKIKTGEVVVKQDGTVADAQKIISETQNKQVVNLPIGAEMHSLQNQNDLNFEPFIKANLRIICASFDIPMEVAMSWYDSNYSASRASLKGFEHTIKVDRKAFADQFYRPFYTLWLRNEILLNKIAAPGYVNAWMDGNLMAIEAYQNCKFNGANIPHIDPLKEVKAERLKLGDLAVPLTSAQAATEAVNGGDYTANVEQVKREADQAKGIYPEEPKPAEEKEDERED